LDIIADTAIAETGGNGGICLLAVVPDTIVGIIAGDAPLDAINVPSL
jgi:hypothetical protein